MDFAKPVKAAYGGHRSTQQVARNFMMENTAAEETVNTLRSLFARLGLPDQIVSENRPQFTSGVFKSLVKENGIRHLTGAPYHLATNGRRKMAQEGSEG